ncbi:hypothetical protein FY557_13115 [Chryseobacterium sp. SN22]|uniref:hypothetical protein n=1 Tax=Chryseobacterium sp. SN22 TaxID=2606431 RepID=UPI0011EDD243|nr:hypothetical protein [Chryseobacterium sp. SN22]KAA0127318.1 hypothetical protein FY557_13115 [Chryseobacterium sp. SN22]
MAEKLFYSSDEVQSIVKKVIEATTIGVLDYVNNESIIIDRFFKNEIPNAIIERNSTKNLSEYIDQELMKIGINYTPIKS